jgi:hypothetical protein
VDVVDPERGPARSGWAVPALVWFLAATLLGAVAAWLLLR